MFATLVQFNESNTPAQADYFALREDWRAVGKALDDALSAVTPEMLNAEAADEPTR
jgi:hypothetical protein